MPPSRGFTLIELMIAIALLAIIASLAAPAMSSFLLNQRVSGQASALSSALQFARSEATTKNRRIKVVPVANSTNGWTQGWCVILAELSNCNGNILRRYDPAPAGVTIEGDYLQTGNVLTFRRNGTRAPAVSGTIKISSANLSNTGNRARCLTLDAIGRVSVEAINRDDDC
ncbi:GspH/FimT family pseudopilin [Pseudomonas sp. Q1-7]|uniref:GspH/FimT family pseudopilin n=1 Tax=Pseudomonas sp. Q1-7 TaxID=3020843 RepID=UPI0023014602|nr:GspH/FimT family protein [Pseudomonas sp. Q1-7]